MLAAGPSFAASQHRLLGIAFYVKINVKERCSVYFFILSCSYDVMKLLRILASVIEPVATIFLCS